MVQRLFGRSISRTERHELYAFTEPSSSDIGGWTEASAPHGALASYNPLPSVVGLDHLFDLLLHCLQVEGGRVLHRRIVNGRLGKVGHVLLDHDEAPELAGEEVVAVAERAGQHGFSPPHREA